MTRSISSSRRPAVQLAFVGELGQVTAKLVEQLDPLLALALGYGCAARRPVSLRMISLRIFFRVSVELRRMRAATPSFSLMSPEQDMLGANVVVTKEAPRAGPAQNLLRPRRKGIWSAATLSPMPTSGYLHAHFVEVHAPVWSTPGQLCPSSSRRRPSRIALGADNSYESGTWPLPGPEPLTSRRALSVNVQTLSPPFPGKSPW